MDTLAAPSRLALYLDLIRWSRPAGTYLLLWPTLAARWEVYDAIDVAINGVLVCRDGASSGDRSEVDMSGREVTITDLAASSVTATCTQNPRSTATDPGGTSIPTG